MTPLSHLCTDDLSDRVVALTDGPPIMLRRVRRDVARLAAWLAMQPGHNWVLASEHPYDFLVSLLAVWHAGKQVTVPASLQPGAVREATAQADGLLDGLGTWQSSTDTATDMDAVLRPFNAERSLLDLFTSGSSGAPKRIRKSAAQLEREIVVLESCWGGEARTRVCDGAAPPHLRPAVPPAVATRLRASLRHLDVYRTGVSACTTRRPRTWASRLEPIAIEPDAGPDRPPGPARQGDPILFVRRAAQPDGCWLFSTHSRHGAGGDLWQHRDWWRSVA